MNFKRLEYFAIAKSLDGLIFVLTSYVGFHFFVKRRIFKSI